MFNFHIWNIDNVNWDSIVWNSMYLGPMLTVWVSVRPMCKILHLEVSVRCKIGRRNYWGQPCRERLRVIDETKAGPEPAVCSFSIESQQYPGLHQKRDGQQGEEGDFSPLLCPCETPSGVLHSVQEPAAQGSFGAFGECPEEGHEDGQRTGSGWESWGYFDYRRPWGNLISDLQYLKGVHGVDEGTLSGSVMTGQGVKNQKKTKSEFR